MSYRRDFSIYRIEEVLCQLKIRCAIEKLKNQPRPLLRPRYVNFSQHFLNLSRKTVPLKCFITVKATTESHMINGISLLINYYTDNIHVLFQYYGWPF
jgi:hypothetical protein